MSLNQRAVACKGWRWLDGAITDNGRRVYAIDRSNYPIGVRGGDLRTRPDCGAILYTSLPNLTDPATLGCLLALVREHFPGCHTEPNGAPECDSDDEAERAHWWAVYACNPHRRVSTGATEAEALIAALECAP